MQIRKSDLLIAVFNTGKLQIQVHDICRWTEGYWDFGPGLQQKWNEVQNTPKDIQLLANHLLVQYRRLVWNRTQGMIPGRPLNGAKAR